MKHIGYRFVRGGGGPPRPRTDVLNVSGEGRPKTVLIVAMFAVVLMAASVIVLAGDETVADDGWTAHGDIQWTVDEYTLKIKGTGQSWDISGDPPWNASTSSITHVEIESGVKSIGKNAFEGCTALEEAKIPSSVVSIGDSAFSGCEALDRVYMEEEGVKTIGSRAFASCSRLSYITPNTSTTHIGIFTLPGTVETIGAEAFFQCTGLKSINIPSSVTTIEMDTFYGCSNLTPSLSKVLSAPSEYMHSVVVPI